MQNEILKFHRAIFFPMRKKEDKNYKYTAIIGFGGNEGNVIKRFCKVIRCWQNDSRLQVICTSAILENPPFGFLEQNNFFNAVVKIKTSLDAKRFLYFLMHTEKCFKRVRSFKNAPRTLDLDIIAFDGFEQSSQRLSIPHPKWSERISVLAPLAFMEKEC